MRSVWLEREERGGLDHGGGAGGFLPDCVIEQRNNNGMQSQLCKVLREVRPQRHGRGNLGQQWEERGSRVAETRSNNCSTDGFLWLDIFKVALQLNQKVDEKGKDNRRIDFLVINRN